MKVNVYEMRDRGVQYRKSDIYRHGPHTGKLEINTTQDNRLNRMSRTAKLFRNWAANEPMQLFDVQLVWMCDDRFTLSGFQQEKNERGQIADYVQSWLCLIGEDNLLPTERDQFEQQRGPHDKHSR